MSEDRIQIIYEAVVRGQEKVEALARENENLVRVNNDQKASIDRLSQSHEKHVSAMGRARQSILAFRKELFAVTFVAAAVAGAIKALSGTSDALGERLEDLGRKASNFLNPVASAIARLMGNKGQLSTGARADILGLQSETARLRGDEFTALMKKQEAERVKLLEAASNERRRIIEKELLARQEAEREAFRLAEIGLKNQAQIFRDFKRDIVDAFRGGTGDTIFKLLQGEKQTAGDIIKGFQTSINRAVADAVSQSLFTTLFQGGGFMKNFVDAITGRKKKDPQIEETNKRLEKIESINARIADCACFTAQEIGNLGRSIPSSINYEAPKVSGIQKAQAILNLTGALAGAGALGAASGGAAGVPNSMAAGPQLNIDPSLYMPRGHSGGMFGRRSFASGGEVPAALMEGEFVVRRPAAQRNKEVLKAMNGGAEAVPGGGGNVFLIRTNDAQSFSQALSTPSARQAIEIQVIRAIMENGGVRSVIKNFGR